MRIYDISQELFAANVYPGDPCPQKYSVMQIENGDICNLTNVSMCCHNGTHIDAPFHFINCGHTVEDIPLEKCIGLCEVIDWGTNEAKEHLRKLLWSREKKILIRGNFELSIDMAEEIAESGIDLIGIENFTIGNEETGPIVHRLLLEKEIVILEGLLLGHVSEGTYFLAAQPVNLGKTDGAPCRAVLLEVPVYER